MADPGVNVSPATYDLIKTWIGQQQQAPAPLTDKLRSALVDLERALQADSVSLVEPEMGDQNWVGMLQEYRAAYPFNGSELNFVETSFDPTGRGPLRWKCQATISEVPGTEFPRADANQPAFARKKDAKKYAAKCAIEALRAKGFMPQNGVRFPKGVLTPHQQLQRQKQLQQHQQTQPAAQKARAGSALTAGKGPALPQAKPISSPPAAAVPHSPFDASQPSATHRVAELCKELGYPAPTYQLAAGDDGFFNGWADFGDYTDLLPPEIAGLSRVTNVISKKAAKEMVAEGLLAPLRAHKAQRDAQNRAFLAQYSDGGMK
ncbi:hypothetical protein GGS24DRAFT_70888 [Hypoxylon argillaceum]|nr:hypothetical protein GGS24DRAFT_70888 [Hypoxylon argillaceum]